LLATSQLSDGISFARTTSGSGLSVIAVVRPDIEVPGKESDHRVVELELGATNTAKTVKKI
jgi:hypothetical protein